MAKITLCLVFALVVAVPVLCEDNPWKTVIEEASKAGVSQDAIFQAQKVISDGSAEKLAQDALGEASLNEWVQQANDMANSGSPPAEAPQDSPDDEEEDNLAPELAPLDAPISAPESSTMKITTTMKMTTTDTAPTQTPSAAPEAQAPSSAT